MLVSVSYNFLPKSPSTRASVVMDHFGVGFETGRHVIADDLELPIEPGDVVCFTGESGSGKSSLMRAAAMQLPRTLNIDELDLGERILIEAIELPAAEAMGLLTSTGLGEAQLMLRTPAELSDGQRYRFRLALALSRGSSVQGPATEETMQADVRHPSLDAGPSTLDACCIVADEFTATLDRTLAKVIAYNVRRAANRSGVGFLLATTHEDVLEDLSPDVHVACSLGEPPVVRRS